MIELHTHTHTHVKFCKKCKVKKQNKLKYVKNVNQY